MSLRPARSAALLLGMAALSVVPWGSSARPAAAARMTAQDGNALATPPAPFPPGKKVGPLLDKAWTANDARKWPEAEQWAEQALKVALEQRDTAGEAAVRQLRSALLNRAFKRKEALEEIRLAVQLRRQLGDRAGLASTLRNQGVLESGTSSFQDAEKSLRESGDLYRELGDRNGEAANLNTLGNLQYFRSEYGLAIASFEAVRVIGVETKDRRTQAVALTNLGNCFRLLGEPQKSLNSYQEVAPLWQALKDPTNQAGVLANIGIVYRQCGQYRRALEMFQEAIPILRDGDAPEYLANTLNSFANAQYDLRLLPEAIASYKEALTLYRRLQDRSGQVSTLRNMARVQSELKLADEANASLDEALKLALSIGDRQGECVTHEALGDVALRAGREEEARAAFTRALNLSRETGERLVQAGTSAKVARLDAKAGHLDEAEKGFLASLEILERYRGALGGLSEAKGGFLATRLRTYHDYIALLLRRGKTEEAFGWVQKTKGRVLLDLMRDGRISVRGRLTPEERERELTLRKEADRLNRAMVAEGVKNEPGAKLRFAALKEELRTAEDTLQRFTDGLYLKYPDLAHKRSTRAATPAELAQWLPKDTALLEYALLRDEGEGTGVLFILRQREGKPLLQAVTLPGTAAALGRQAAALRQACADPRQAYALPAQTAYQSLLAPASSVLGDVKRLVICPDGGLWEAPFAAMLMGGTTGKPDARNSRFVADRFTVSYAYSATTAQAARESRDAMEAPRKPEGAALLALANPDFGGTGRFGDNGEISGQRPLASPSRPLTSPSRPITSPSRPITSPSRPITSPSRPLTAPSRPLTAPSRPLSAPSRALDPNGSIYLSREGEIQPLPGTQQEADRLRREFKGAAVFTGMDAQEAVVKAEAGKYRYLHFATHGFTNDAAPLLSSIVLATPTDDQEDGFLTARELFELDLHAELVTLSACNTARGEQRSGEGIIGLTWALFVAGAPSQVVSQWAVDDQSTARLMDRFYHNLREGDGKATSLRNAALRLRQDNKTQHPYYWAPFVLMGDWR